MRSGFRLVGFAIGLFSIVLGMVAAASPAIGLTPCASLDVSLGLSGCRLSFEGSAVAIAPDRTRIAIATVSRGSVELRSLVTGETQRRLETGGVESLTFSPNGEVLLVGRPGGAQLWRVNEGSFLRALGEGDVRALAAEFSPTGTVVATVSAWETEVRLWDIATGQQLRSLSGSRPGPSEVRFSPDGSILAAVFGDGTAVGWSTTTWEPVFRIADPTFVVRQLQFSPDGRSLAATSGRLSLRLLDSRNWTTIAELHGEEVAFSPGGELIATANGGLRLWRVADGAEIVTFEGHDFEVEDVVFSPDGTRLASAGGYEGTVRVWRTVDGAPIRTIEVPGGRSTVQRVTGVGFMADGRSLISLQGYATQQVIRLWSPDYRVAKLPTWLGVASSIGLGIATLLLGLPATWQSNWPGRWAGGIALIGGSFMLWGPLWLLEGDGTTYVAIFFGAVATFGYGLQQIVRSYRWRVRWR